MTFRNMCSSVAVSLSLCVVACGGPSYDRSDVTDVAQGNLSTVVSLTTVSMPLGAATKALINHYDDDNKVMSSNVVSDGPTIIEIAPGLAAGEFIFMARTVGITTVKFLADGQVIAIAKAEVTPQGAP